MQVHRRLELLAVVDLDWPRVRFASDTASTTPGIRDQFLILATDGVWDNLPLPRVSAILKTKAPLGTGGEEAALAVARAVTLEARRSAEEGSQMRSDLRKLLLRQLQRPWLRVARP